MLWGAHAADSEEAFFDDLGSGGWFVYGCLIQLINKGLSQVDGHGALQTDDHAECHGALVACGV